MKELPRSITALFLVLGFLFISYVAYQIYRSSSTNSNQQYLDQLDVKTDNPQPAGKNITP